MNIGEAIERFKDFVRELNTELQQDSHLDQTIVTMEPVAIFGKLMLTGDMVGKLNDLEEEIFDAVRQRGHISRKGTESLLHSAIDAVIGENDHDFEQRLTTQAETLRRDLQAEPFSWDHFFRVVGFDAASLPLEFGKVRFFVAAEESVRDLIDRLSRSIDGTTNSVEQKDAAKATMAGLVRQAYVGQVLANVTTTAIDSEAATALAVGEVRRTLDALNFFASWHYPPRSKLALPWEGARTQEKFVAFKQTAGQAAGRESASISSQGKGAVIPSSTNQMKRIPGFARCSALLTRPNPTPFELRVLSALTWAGRAAVEERDDQSFLFYVISLENLLLGSNKDSEIGYRFRVRGAHLLGLNLGGKKIVQRHLRNLYALRSKIVHSGSAQIKDSDVSMVRYFVQQAVLHMLNDPAFANMTSEEQLESYFDEKVLQ